MLLWTSGFWLGVAFGIAACIYVESTTRPKMPENTHRGTQRFGAPEPATTDTGNYLARLYGTTGNSATNS